MRKIPLITAALLFHAAAAVAQESVAPAPRVEYHQHLLSPAVAAFWNGPAVSTVPLPPEFSRLLARRDSAFEDDSAMAALYTDDAFVLANPGGGPASFERGRGPAASQVANLFAGPCRITPVDVRMEGDAGHVAGYLTRLDGSLHFGHIILAFRREADGAWRIAHETLSFPGPRTFRPITADSLVPLLDQAGIERAARAP